MAPFTSDGVQLCTSNAAHHWKQIQTGQTVLDLGDVHLSDVIAFNQGLGINGNAHRPVAFSGISCFPKVLTSMPSSRGVVLLPLGCLIQLEGPG